MSADVEVGDFEPEIKVDVVLFAALETLVILTPRPSHDQELVVEAAKGVAVASVLHVIHAEAIEDIRAVVDDLEALLETGGLPLNITASNEEDLVAWRLDVSEVVLETLLHVDGAAEDLLLHHVVLVDVLGVALQDVNRAQVAAVGDDDGQDRGEGGCHGLCLGRSSCSTYHGWASLDGRQAVDVVVRVAVKSALTPLLVEHVVVVEPVALALGAVEAEHILQEVGHDSVGLFHLDLLVALRAWQVLCHLVILGHVPLEACKLAETVVAGARPTLGTLKDAWDHEHADGALKVLRLDA